MLLRFGSRGPAVVLVQQRLLALGFYRGSVDGIFGSLTVVAVKSFQTSVGLTPDGIVGPRTMAALTMHV